ncbi:MAG: hypothetical protein KAT52_08350, partial [Desulfobacterales bacterium]|nr:hypothetical protein [Desulfobacterales bacterium]
FANLAASRSWHISSQKIAQLRYKNIKFERRLRADVLVENKGIKKITRRDKAQFSQNNSLESRPIDNSV